MSDAHCSAKAASRSFFFPGNPKAAKKVHPLSNMKSLFISPPKDLRQGSDSLHGNAQKKENLNVTHSVAVR